jgi:LCP family protein required for cell wall assembly
MIEGGAMGKKVLLITLTSLTVFILTLVSFTFQFVTSTGASMNEDIEHKEKYQARVDDLSLTDGDPISILLMGVDTRSGEEGGRADTMVLMTLNPQSKSIEMVSIPRDTHLKIDGGLDKINSSYQIGGPAETIKSVEKLLDVPVDYFIEVNMKGFEGIVNAYGGVEVNNDLEFTDKHVHFPKGEIKLDGKEALIYARMRKKDPRGDFGRQKRQRQVIEALMQKGESIESVTKFGEIIDVIQHNVKTNMNPIEMWNIQANYKSARETMEAHKIEGKDKTFKGTYYYMPDKKNLNTISLRLKKHLELISNDEADQNRSKIKKNAENNKKSGDLGAATHETNRSKSDQDTEMKDQDPETERSYETAKNEAEEKDTDKNSNETGNQPNVKRVIKEDWKPVPTRQTNHTKVTFDEGSLDWEEMTEAIAKGANLTRDDMILWWVEGKGMNNVMATVTNKTQTENYRVHVKWIEGRGYAAIKVEELYENDQKNR